MVRVYIESLGCDSSISDSHQLIECCMNNNLDITANFLEADFIILFSCGFNKVILSKNIGKIEEFRTNKKAKIILAGCVPNIEKSTRHLADYSIGPKELYLLDDILKFKKSIKLFSPKFIRQDREIIRIATGCCGECSYCAIKIATGYVSSRSEKEIIADIKNGLKKGIRKFVLTSEDNGSWGQDCSKDITILLEEINKTKGSFKMLLTTFNPRWFIKYPKLFDLLKSEKFEKNIYLSLQSASNRILNLMKRDYTVEDYLNIYYRLKKEIPSIKIRSDFLIGFPSETEEDFMKTYNIIKKLDFYFLEVFAYTDMKDTLAIKLKPKVSNSIKISRVKNIIKLFLDKNKDQARPLIQTNIKYS
jgi:MiaB/RimO family radical SAM methylthiotransferase